MRLLIAEDDPALGRFLARGMEQDGHEVTMATNGEMAMEAMRNDLPEMAVLDLNLPRRDGTEVLEFLRTLTEDVPVLILTARKEPEVRLRCLEMGADDFMQKPFSFAELRARCRALQRRRSPGLVLRQGDVEMKRVERLVTCQGKAVTLTTREFALLEYLLLHRGRAVSRATLLREVWNMSEAAGTNVVDVYINYLRRKLESAGAGAAANGSCDGETLIRTVRGVGYAIGRETGTAPAATAV
ncbi:MAG TPA: response regulator transcription factor [Acidobacteriaceae bacterium]|nr:response regulator transcription factor [Acidobacteriaceae bacterium]